MTARLVRRDAATRLGVTGGTLGLLAGVLQATVGSHLGAWSGNKGSPAALGLLTVLLSAAAVAAALALRSPQNLSAPRRTVIAIGLLVPGVLCFTTVGRLWYLPGAMLLTSFAFTLATGGTGELRAVLRANWTRGLVSLLGAFEILMAVSARPVLTIAVGVVGGAVLMAAPWIPRRPGWAPVAALLVGALPFALLTWWSAASPLLAIVALAIGLPAVRIRPLSGVGPARIPWQSRHGTQDAARHQTEGRVPGEPEDVADGIAPIGL